MKAKRSMLLLLTIFVPMGCAIWYFIPNRTNPPVAVLRLLDFIVTVRAGEKQTVLLNIDRRGIQAPIALSFPNPHLRLHVMVQEGSVSAGVETVRLEVEAKEDIDPGVKMVTVRADCGDLHDSRTVQVTILPLETLPANFEKPKGAKVVSDSTGKKYYQRIEAVRGTTRVPFLLVASNVGHPPTFYIMENKVWAGLYRQFAETQPKGASGLKSTRWDELAKVYKDERCPVLGTDVEDADRCANWLGGRLPSQAQWDKAAGRGIRSEREGPYQSPWNPKARPLEVAVNVDKALEKPRPDKKGTETHPLPVGEAIRDKSPFDCRDMSGNGLEWTRDASLGRQIPLSPKENRAGQFVLLRGWDFRNPKPLDFKFIDPPESDDYSKPVNDIGFRVAIEPR